MEKVDRLGWAAGFSINAYGLRIGVRSNQRAALDRARERLPDGSTIGSSTVVDFMYSIIFAGNDPLAKVRRFNLLYADHVRLVRSSDADQVFDTFESELRLTLAEHGRTRVFIHAGVVGWKGKAIVIPGRTFTGKSTLVAELVKAGAAYYSDEYAVIDSRGRVHPFHKPIELRDGPGGAQVKVDVATLGGKLGTKPLPVGLVLSTQFRMGATYKPREIRGGRAILELLSNTVSARQRPTAAVATLERVVSDAKVLKGVRGDAAQSVQAILASCEG